MTDTPEHVRQWNDNYVRGRSNRYPFEPVVGFVMRNFAALDRGKVRILDLGCGGGNHMRFLRDEGFDAYGVDGAEQSVALTKQFIGDASSDRVQVAGFESLPFTDAFFDAVIDRQSMGHNPLSRIVRIIPELFRVLRPGGLYYGHVFGDRTVGFTKGTHLGDGDYGHFTSGGFSQAHLVHAFTADEVRALFSNWESLALKRFTTEDIASQTVETEVIEIVAKRP